MILHLSRMRRNVYRNVYNAGRTQAPQRNTLVSPSHVDLVVHLSRELPAVDRVPELVPATGRAPAVHRRHDDAVRAHHVSEPVQHAGAHWEPFRHPLTVRAAIATKIHIVLTIRPAAVFSM